MRPVLYTATAADVTNGYTPPVVVDYIRTNGQYGVRYLNAANGAGTGTVQSSLDNPFTVVQTSMVWTTVAVSNNQAKLNEPVTAFRILNPVLGDTLLVVAQGASPAG